MTTLALDVGGSKMTAALVGFDGRPEDPLTVPTPASGVWAACTDMLDAVAHGSVIDRVGIAAAGPVDLHAGSAAPINIPEWRGGFGIVDAVSAKFPGATVHFAVDGGCAALAEYRFGAGRGHSNLLSLVVSTGIGGGLLLDGKIVHGRSGNAGHIGHIVVPGSTMSCTCGGIGCVETVASGPSTVRWAREHGWRGRTGLDLSEDADAGDATARAALHRSGTALGQAIASAAALVDVTLVVVGGGFAQSAGLWEPLLESVARHAGLGFLRELMVVPAELGGVGTLTGAGLLGVHRM